MEKIFKSSALFVIYSGIGVTLLVPLLVDSGFLFPFISTKVFLFRLVVEIMLLAYLVLNIFGEEYRPRGNWLVAITGLFILVAIVSSLLGGNFHRSFWGDVERGEGIILWLHLLVFVVILMSVLRSQSVWQRYLNFSLGVTWLAGLLGLAQAFKSSIVLATSGTRVDATFGNPAFFAAYLLMHIAIAAYLFFESRNKAAKVYYFVSVLFFSWLVFATQTRGAVVGLLGGAVVAAVLSAWRYRGKPIVRKVSFGVIIAVIALASLVFVFRNSPVVKESDILKRVASISLNDRTAETRLATWKTAFLGWKEKFLLGWGYENFDMVFNKYFPAIIYEDEGSQIWFDRAHSVIFDRGVTTGILGLLVFSGFFAIPGFWFLRKGLRDETYAKSSIVFFSFLCAYFVQDLFVFETPAIYIVLFLILTFFASRFPIFTRQWRLPNSKLLWIGMFVVYLVAFWPVAWQVNLYPAKVNAAASSALRHNFEEEDFFAIVNEYKKVLQERTYGRPEYRIQFIEKVDLKLSEVGEVVPEVAPWVQYFDEEVEKQIMEQPRDAKSLLLAMRHYNYTFRVNPQTEIERLNKALEIFQRLEPLSPDRPQVPQEAGYSHLYLFRRARDGNVAAGNAEEHLQAAVKYFQKTIEINPRVTESYINLIMAYLNAGATQEIYRVIEDMTARSLPFREPAYLSRLFNLAKANQNFTWIAYFAREMTERNPNNIDAWVDLALAEAYLGHNDRAIEVAQRIKEFGGSYIQEADEFIKNVRAGVFKLE